MNDLDTLRPEVREAPERMTTPLDESVLSGATAKADARCMDVIRAELRRLATRNAELEAKATRDHDWISDLLAENKKAEAELAALKNENAQLRDVLADRDMDREMAAHAHKELAALKARIAKSQECGVVALCGGGASLSHEPYPSLVGKRVRLVVDSDD